MILKLKVGNESLRFLDGIVSIISNPAVIDEESKVVTCDDGVVSFDRLEYLEKRPNANGGMVLLFIQRRGETEPVVIATANTVFLMSDEGKTIERLN